MAKEIQGGVIRKWDRDEQGEPLAKMPSAEKPLSVKGFLRALRQVPSAFGPDKLGWVLDLDRGQESETWSVPAVLYSKLQNVRPGTPIEIRYEGRTRNKSGNEQHAFRVFELTEAEASDLDIPGE